MSTLQEPIQQESQASIALSLTHRLARAKHAPNPLEWEGGEHTYIGNQIELTIAPNQNVQAVNLPIDLGNGCKLTYGQILALGGDFYGLPDSPISDAPDPGACFLQAYGTLTAQGVADEANAILTIMQTEIDAVNAAIKAGKPASSAYEALGDTLSAQWNRATGGGSILTPWFPMGRYLKLAATNWDHFSPWSSIVYKAGHFQAMTLAAEAGQTHDAGKLMQAYAMNAFADHFLSDMFSAGHMRTPRKQLYDACHPSALGSLCSRYMHDEDCAQGLQVMNASKETWIAFGDKKYFDANNSENAKRCLQAVQVSATDIWLAYTGQAQPSQASALALVPDYQSLIDSRGGPNPPALFIWQDNSVQRRSNLSDRSTYAWTKVWLTAPTLFELSRLAPPGERPVPMTSINDLLVLQQVPGANATLGMTLLSPAPGGFASVWQNGNLGAMPQAAQWHTGDFDGDGIAEVLQVNLANGQCAVTLYQQAAGTGGYMPEPVQALAAATGDAISLVSDINGDGILELIIVDNVGGDVNLTAYNFVDGNFKQLCSTTTPFTWDLQGLRVVSAKLDGGLSSAIVVVYVCEQSVSVAGYRWDAAGGMLAGTRFDYGAAPVKGPAYAATVGDVNGDGKDEVIFFIPHILPDGSTTTAAAVFRVDGQRIVPGAICDFKPETGASFSIVMGDVNNDQQQEVICVCSDKQTMEVWQYQANPECFVSLTRNDNIGPVLKQLVTTDGPNLQAGVVLISGQAQQSQVNLTTYAYANGSGALQVVAAQAVQFQGPLNDALPIAVLTPILPS